MGKSTRHTSSVDLIRNLRTGFLLPQFYVVYDKKNHTVMGGYDDNKAVRNHIWDILVPVDEILKLH